MKRNTLIASTGKLLALLAMAANVAAAPVVLDADPATSTLSDHDLRTPAPYHTEAPVSVTSLDLAAPAAPTTAATATISESNNLPLAAAAGVALLVAQLRRRKHAHAA